MVVDLKTWREVVKRAGHTPRTSAVDERFQVLLKNSVHWKSFDTPEQAMDYALKN